MHKNTYKFLFSALTWQLQTNKGYEKKPNLTLTQLFKPHLKGFTRTIDNRKNPNEKQHISRKN